MKVPPKKNSAQIGFCPDCQARIVTMATKNGRRVTLNYKAFKGEDREKGILGPLVKGDTHPCFGRRIAERMGSSRIRQEHFLSKKRGTKARPWHRAPMPANIPGALV